MPAPHRPGTQSDSTGNGLAVLVTICRICAFERCGATASINEITPDTIGAAKLVPPVDFTLSPNGGGPFGVVVPVLLSTNTPSSGSTKLIVPPGADTAIPVPKLL